MATSAIPNPNAYTDMIVCETKQITFSNGKATVNGKSGYFLANVVVVARPVSEEAYSVTSYTRDTSGNYYLQNKTTNLSNAATFMLVWVKN